VFRLRRIHSALSVVLPGSALRNSVRSRSETSIATGASRRPPSRARSSPAPRPPAAQNGRTSAGAPARPDDGCLLRARLCPFAFRLAQISADGDPRPSTGRGQEPIGSLGLEADQAALGRARRAIGLTWKRRPCAHWLALRESARANIPATGRLYLRERGVGPTPGGSIASSAVTKRARKYSRKPMSLG
jgi:hypothetical protein